MACIKCGRDTDENQVFCEKCRDLMQWYPVKPGTAVQLPQRQEIPQKKTPKRRGPTPEEQMKTLRRRIRALWIFLILAVLLAAALAYPAYLHFTKDGPLPGQNYSTVTQPAVNTTAGTTAGD